MGSVRPDELPRAFGPYMLLERAGGGGHGEVFIGRSIHAPDRGPVAIKVLHEKLLEDELFIQRFKHEAELAVAIDSPHVVRVLETGKVGETLYIAMELIAGWPLSAILDAIREERRFLELPWIVKVVGDALRGVAALHRAKDREGRPIGGVHRDISPKNIMIAEDGRGLLIDLGVGKSRLQEFQTRAGVVTGTPGYMAPEQVRGEVVDHRVDLYAIGLVLFEAITLAPYIKRRANWLETMRASVMPKFVAPSSVRPEVPAALDRVVERALDVERGDRFQSAEEMIAALEAAVAPEVASAGTLRRAVGETLWSRREEPTVAWVPPAALAEQPIERSEVFARRAGVELIAARSESRFVKIALAIGIFVPISVVVAVLLRDRPTPIVAVPRDASVVEAPRVVALPREELEPPPIEQPEEKTKRVRRRGVTAAAPDASVAPPPVEPVAPVDRWVASPRDYVSALIARAQRAKASLDPARARELDLVIADLQQLLASPRLADERALAEAQERRLRELTGK